jgi:hypothetical protein
MDAHSTEVGKLIGVALLASVKFLFSPFAAQGMHLTFWESLLATTVGGIAGILVFGLIGELITDKWANIMGFFFQVFTSRNKEEARRYARRKFKPKNRFIVKVKHRLGLFGLALITPCMISIPFGAIACMAFFNHRRKEVFVYLFLSLGFWSLLLNVGAYFLKLSRLFS